MPISRFWVSRGDIHTIRGKNFLTDSDLKGTQEKAPQQTGSGRGLSSNSKYSKLNPLVPKQRKAPRGSQLNQPLFTLSWILRFFLKTPRSVSG